MNIFVLGCSFSNHTFPDPTEPDIPQMNWPQILSKKLQQENVDATIYNIAHISNSTQSQAIQLRYLIDQNYIKSDDIVIFQCTRMNRITFTDNIDKFSTSQNINETVHLPEFGNYFELPTSRFGFNQGAKPNAYHAIHVNMGMMFDAKIRKEVKPNKYTECLETLLLESVGPYGNYGSWFETLEIVAIKQMLLHNNIKHIIYQHIWNEEYTLYVETPWEFNLSEVWKEFESYCVDFGKFGWHMATKGNRIIVDDYIYPRLKQLL